MNKQERHWIGEIRRNLYCGQVNNPADQENIIKLYYKYVEVTKLVSRCLDLFAYFDIPKEILREEMEDALINLKNAHKEGGRNDT